MLFGSHTVSLPWPLAITGCTAFLLCFASSTIWNKCSYTACTLPIWLLPLSKMFWRFVHVIVYVRSSCLLTAEQYFIALTDHTLFIWSPEDRHLGCSHFLAAMNNTAINICGKVLSWKYALYLSKYYLTEYFIELHSNNKIYGSLKKCNLFHINKRSAIYSFWGNLLNNKQTKLTV